jgi:hypothetical protein
MLFNQTHGLTYSLRHIFSHVTISMLAIGIAFSLPVAAQYILYSWWPRVEDNSILLMVTEVVFAAALVLLFNVSKIAWDSRRQLKATALASLVHARESGDWFSRRNDREIRKNLQGTREISILSVTGSEVFDSDNWVRHLLDSCCEVRVLLMDPEGRGAYERTRLSLNPEAVRNGYRREIEETLAQLAKLARAGKRVSIKFYDTVPFWKMVVAGDFVQVQYCYGTVMSKWPEYIFALRKDHPGQGLFTPFYVSFLQQWQNQQVPEYDFETQQLVFRNVVGEEIRRELFNVEADRKQIADSSLKSIIGKFRHAKLAVKETEEEAA